MSRLKAMKRDRDAKKTPEELKQREEAERREREEARKAEERRRAKLRARNASYGSAADPDYSEAQVIGPDGQVIGRLQEFQAVQAAHAAQMRAAISSDLGHDVFVPHAALYRDPQRTLNVGDTVYLCRRCRLEQIIQIARDGGIGSTRGLYCTPFAYLRRQILCDLQRPTDPADLERAVLHLMGACSLISGQTTANALANHLTFRVNADHGLERTTTSVWFKPPAHSGLDAYAMQHAMDNQEMEYLRGIQDVSQYVYHPTTNMHTLSGGVDIIRQLVQRIIAEALAQRFNAGVGPISDVLRGFDTASYILLEFPIPVTSDVRGSYPTIFELWGFVRAMPGPNFLRFNHNPESFYNEVLDPQDGNRPVSITGSANDLIPIITFADQRYTRNARR